MMTRAWAASLLLPWAAAEAIPQSWQEPPRLVVGIVVDQMRTDHIYRYWNNFGEGGFRRIVKEGAFLRDAHYDHMPTETGPGHASIYTGTTPSRHGITANDLFDRGLGRMVYCAEDREATVVGAEAGPQRSPRNLLANTLADELERRTAGRARTIAVSWKDRGSILPIGRTGDAAYWYLPGTEGAFVTSSWYRAELPVWVKDFNARGPSRQLLSEPWDLLLPRERYTQVLPDDNPYEIPLTGAVTATLPQDLPSLFAAAGNTALLGYTPGSNTLITEFALTALDAEELGRDAVTDLLAVSYSAPDMLGHRMGLRALELEDLYLRLDQEIARLLRALDERVGAGRYTLFLTSDHGAVDVPQYLKDIKGSAGYVDPAELRQRVDDALGARHGKGAWVKRIASDQIWLNDSLAAARKVDPAQLQRLAVDALLSHPLVHTAWSAHDLVRSGHADGVMEKMRNGFMPQRSGDVLYVLRPGYFERVDWAPGRGTTHGSPWNYDTHVPILFMGRGIRAADVVRRTSVSDIAATVAAVVGMTMPDACSGRVVHEVIAP